MNTYIYDNKYSIKANANAIKIKRVRESELDKLNSKHNAHKQQQHSTESILVLDNKNNKNMSKRSMKRAEKHKILNINMNSNQSIENQMKFDKNLKTQSPKCWFALTKKIYEKKISFENSQEQGAKKITLKKKMKTFDFKTSSVVKMSSPKTKLIELLEEEAQETSRHLSNTNNQFNMSTFNGHFEPSFLLSSTLSYPNTQSNDASKCSCINSCESCKDKDTLSNSLLCNISEFENSSYFLSSTPVTFKNPSLQNQLVDDDMMIKRAKKEKLNDEFENNRKLNLLKVSNKISKNARSKKAKRKRVNDITFFETIKKFKQMPRTSSSIDFKGLNLIQEKSDLKSRIKMDWEKNFMLQNSFTTSTVTNENFTNFGDFLVWYV
jgi:hypothetical protein